MGSDKMIPRHVYDKPFIIRFPDRSEWKEGFLPDRKGRLIWYTDGSKTNKGTGAGMYRHGTGQKLSFSLGQYTTVFQSEVYAIKACTAENLDKNYKNRNIYILSNSQAAIKALGKYKITSKLVWDRHQSLIKLTKHNGVQLIWVPGHESIADNEVADQLARTGSEHPFTGPKPACGISIRVAKKAVRDWMSRNHKKTLGIRNWTQTNKGTHNRALCQKNEGSVKIKQRAVKMGGGTIYRTPFQTGITDDPTCERCLEKDESVTHILYDCESIAYLKFCHLGQFLWNARINKVLRFIRSVGLIKRKHNRSLKVGVHGPEGPTPYAFIHSWTSS
jgi:ribonuclease HI